ncbi:MAG: hypothetical protein NTX24_05470 [Candidatus Pacearchaeota archaeon]|nr:hypothetical protein [Candidatus Pacearchaeota archaeon]
MSRTGSERRAIRELERVRLEAQSGKPGDDGTRLTLSERLVHNLSKSSVGRFVLDWLPGVAYSDEHTQKAGSYTKFSTGTREGGYPGSDGAALLEGNMQEVYRRRASEEEFIKGYLKAGAVVCAVGAAFEIYRAIVHGPLQPLRDFLTVLAYVAHD